jgi:hypothetical protein
MSRSLEVPLMSTHPIPAPARGEPRRSSVTPEEWDAVQWAARAVAEAAHAGDLDLRSARLAELQSILAGVRQRRGDHPALWELEADFTTDPAEAADLYMRAERAAADAGLPTLSMRLSLARLLVEELGFPGEARAVLLACKEALPSATEEQCATWGDLLADCQQRLGSSAS